MIEVIFLFLLGFIWMSFAVIQDLRTKEIANWLNFSLIIFAIGFRFFYSLFSGNGFEFFYQGLMGLGIFFLIGNLLYYGKMFAGGDAKLMIALGAVLPLSENFFLNLAFFLTFIMIFLLVGAGYSFLTTLVLSIQNHHKFKKEFFVRFKRHKKAILLILPVAIALLATGFFVNVLILYLGILLFVMPYIYLYTKSVDEACMVRQISTSRLTEGDWLYKNVKAGGKTIKAEWSGLSKEDVRLLKKKHKTVLIRYGIPFSPVFLISFIIIFWLYSTKLWGFLF